jgi:hypothetical protein
VREHSAQAPQPRQAALAVTGPAEPFDEELVDLQSCNRILALQSAHSRDFSSQCRHVRLHLCITLNVRVSLGYLSLTFSFLGPAVSLEGEKYIKDRQQNYKDMRVRGNRLVIYNQIIQPPKGITVDDTNVARIAFKLNDADENR